MIGVALARKMIPGECFSKKGGICISAMMTKIFLCDESRITTTVPVSSEMIFQIVTIG